MKKEEFYETNYSLDEIEMDPRFIICEKEMKLVFGVQIIFTLVSIIAAYLLGSGDPNNYSYILGLPTWWFAIIVISVIFTGVVIYITKFKLVDMELSDEVENDDLAVK
ncbi:MULTISPECIES: YhdT family protein [unclassified Sedimentibacter]|uniref:YhdT family protein n=1 Tax=unclassified Sedimentibacter TaxID=2649220 RepID=UPI0027DEE930|nr:YhdT family protein [Sedimentibacter sp. MB35-C1]WMJ78444.1 YhdT family protein [Sedimentibacter sp. MB35-C1]